MRTININEYDYMKLIRCLEYCKEKRREDNKLKPNDKLLEMYVNEINDLIKSISSKKDKMGSLNKY